MTHVFHSVKVIPIIVLMISFFHCSPVINDSAVVFLVNGEPVTVTEFKLEMHQGHLAATYGYFYQKHGAQDCKDFWTSRFNRENPLEYAKEQTLAALKERKVQQIQFKKYGIRDDISFSQFQKDLKKENQHRKEALADNQVIYGPVEFQEYNYLNYCFSNDLIKLKEVLAADVFSITETDLKKHYNAVKKVKYKIPNKFNIQRLWVQEKPTAALHELFAALLDASQKGVDFPSLAAGFSTERFKVNYETRKFNEDTAGYDERRFLEIKQIVATLSLNEISGVIRNQGFLNIIKLISRETMGFYCFDKTKENVHRDYVEKLYEHYLHDLLSRAKVKINKKVYHTITAGR